MVRGETPRSRRTALKTIGGLATVGLAGCATGPGNGGGNGNGSNGGNGGGGGQNLSGSEVHFLTDQTSDAAKDLQEKIASDFESETGAKVQIEYVGPDTSSTQRISQLLQAGSPPEIFMANKGNAGRYHANGVLAPVDDVFEIFKSRAGDPHQHAPLEIDGSQWMIPLWSNYASYWYRQDVADVVPDTWDKMLEYGKQADGTNNLAGIYVPAGTGGHSIWRLMTWLHSNNGQVSAWDSDQIKIVFDEGQNRQRMIETLEFIKQRYQYSPSATDSSWTTILSAMANGVAASQWSFGVFSKAISISQEKDFADAVKFQPIPFRRDGGTTLASVDGMIQFKQANTEAANAFMKFFTQEKYLMQIYKQLTPISNAPVWSGILESNEYTEFVKSRPWSTEDINAYLNPENPQTRMGETDPANPLGGVVYGTPPLWNLVSDVLVREKGIETAIDEYAPKLQQRVDNAQR